MKPLLVLFAFVSTVATAAVTVLAWIGSERGLHPRPVTLEYRAEAFDLPIEAVRFESLDGTRLAGWYVPGTKTAAIVLAHGYGSRREEMLPHAAFLHDAGYSLLLFDFRAAGESGGTAVTVGAMERLDVLGAVRYLRHRSGSPDAPIMGLGVSMGASALILAASESEEIVALVAECAFRSAESAIAQSFRSFTGLPAFPCAPLTVWLAERKAGVRVRDVRPDVAVRKLNGRRLLLIHGLADGVIDPSNSRAVHAAAAAGTDLWLVDAAPHARAYQTCPEAYRERVLAFFTAAEAGSGAAS